MSEAPKYKKNFSAYIANAVSLTVEETLNSSKTPTVTFELRKPSGMKDGTFDNQSKFGLQVSPDTELIELMAVLLTYKQHVNFSFHGDNHNKSLIVEWITQEEALKITIFIKGEPRFIKLKRSKVLELSFFVANRVRAYIAHTQETPKEEITFHDIEQYIARVYRPFRDKLNPAS